MAPQNDKDSCEELLASSKLLGVYLLTVTLGAIYLLIYTWPESGEDEPSIILTALLAGALGSQIHALASFAAHTGSKQFDSAWTWWFIFRPVLGALLALVFYFSIRGGLLLMVDGGATEIRVSGVAAIAMLVGLFTEQATHKLKELFDTLFAVNGKTGNKGNKAPAQKQSEIRELNPKSVKKGSKDTTMELIGENLTEGLVVKMDDQTYTTSVDAEGRCQFTLPEKALQKEGKKTLVVSSKDKKELATLTLEITTG